MHRVLEVSFGFFHVTHLITLHTCTESCLWSYIAQPCTTLHQKFIIALPHRERYSSCQMSHLFLKLLLPKYGARVTDRKLESFPGPFAQLQSASSPAVREHLWGQRTVHSLGTFISYPCCRHRAMGFTCSIRRMVLHRQGEEPV